MAVRRRNPAHVPSLPGTNGPRHTALPGRIRRVTGTKLYLRGILEGTRLTHKTDLALALNEHARLVGPRRDGPAA